MRTSNVGEACPGEVTSSTYPQTAKGRGLTVADRFIAEQPKCWALVVHLLYGERLFSERTPLAERREYTGLYVGLYW